MGLQNVNEKRHFNTFDALRFLAFFKVFLLHLPIVAFPWFAYIKAGGGIGVQFFFVLSGFLITYIILEEQRNTGTLNLKNFFVRRVLRIWPLYYLMVLVAYTTPFLLELLHLSSSSEGYEPDLWASLFFLENYKMMITGTYANASPLSVMWSLCIEEHFYIVWGAALYFLKLKGLLKMIIIGLVLGVLSRYIYVSYNLPTSDLFTNIDLFAIGALPAYILIKYPGKLEETVDRLPRWCAWLFLVVLVVVVTLCSQYTLDKDFIWLTLLLGIMFSTLIMFTLGKMHGLKISNSNLMSRLGIYTYGLYLYHTLVINLLLQVFKKYSWSVDEPLQALAFLLISLLVTVLVSVMSYHLFEKQFLKLKKHFRSSLKG